MEKQKHNMEDLKKILYNIFGYYAQFLHIVLEHIEAVKSSVSADLREIVKLYRWERVDNYLSLETTKRIRQKLKKHIQKFNDVLQQPFMVILKQEEAKGGDKVQSVVKQKVSEKNTMVLLLAVDEKPFIDTERSIWYTDWRKKVDCALEYWSCKNISKFNLRYLCLKDAKETEDFIRQSLTCQAVCPIYCDKWKELWSVLQKICRTIIECADLWEIEKKSFGKRRALSDLLKLLESCGLSRRRSVISEGLFKCNQPNSWFLQPSYNVQHLLLPLSDENNMGDATSSSQFKMSISKSFDSNWKIANQYYYRSMANVQLLKQICLNFHKDISLDQVTRSASFLEHLILTQQEQRYFAYAVSEDLKGLRKCINLLKDIHTNPSFINDAGNSESSLSLKQDPTRKCMWDQKKMFDNLCAISHETILLLKKVEATHLNTCGGVKIASKTVLAFIEKLIPNIQKSKESLDLYLLGGSRILTAPEAFSRPFIVTKQMELLVMQNFELINELEGHMLAFLKKDVGRSVVGPLIRRFIDVLNKEKVTMHEYLSTLEPKYLIISGSENGASVDPEAEFAKSFNKTLELIREVFQSLGSSPNGLTVSEDLLSGNITQWKVLVQSYQENMKLDLICKQLSETITSAVHLIDHVGSRTPDICCQIQTYLIYLNMLVDPILTLGDGFLLEFLSLHRTVAEMTHILATVFSSLFSKGFGASTEGQTDDTGDGTSQDASGTGMGEGAGINDVSDQIEDEDQLLGLSEKPTDDLDTPNEDPSKNEKGIEMDQDFAADTFSVSEDSGDDDNDNEDDENEKLDSAMGKTGDNSEVVDEKLWNKDDDGNPDTNNEKYESGPSVKDIDTSSRELRAKEDDACTMDDSGDINSNESDKDNINDADQNDPEHDENVDDLKLDKETAYADPTGIDLDGQNQSLDEDANMSEPEGSDTKEENEGTETTDEVDPGDHNDTGENENHEDGKIDKLDDMENGECEQVDGEAGTDNPAKDHDEVSEMDLLPQSKNEFEQGDYNFTGNTVPLANYGMQQNADALKSESISMEPRVQWSNVEDTQNGLAPAMGLPSGSMGETKSTVPDSVNGGKQTAEVPKAQSPKHDNSYLQKAHPNPYRSVGDALEKWKERVNVAIDSEEQKEEAPDNMEDDNADEYGFVPESEKGTSQALGPATSEQIDRNIRGTNQDGDETLTEHREDITNKEVQEQDSETLPARSHSALMQKLNEQMQNSDLNHEEPITRAQGGGNDDDEDDTGTVSRNLVSLKKSYMGEEILQFSTLSVNDDLGKVKNLEVCGDNALDAATVWRRYEQITTRLSQELAEQLRLIMEPTLANKLQGDYKTGKRINMKKVIAYIASSFRKDKIWLKRTRPNKRDYQVVVAVDDSRSMSESHCGNVAIEALVTVCRAMSQLEVGQLAVASFGKKGNIRLLHDFNEQFTGEAGMKMVSSLTFEQENTIADEPVVDLLQYLNNMLDDAAANSRLPSGQNPLQQLVLIIADGRFHEKERLKRYVRDLISKNIMVAFLLVDSPKDSIMDFMEVSFEGEKFTYLKYLNSFPFPYYIVLKDIEALPRTLADLLRQWFELMQNRRD